MGQVKFFKGCLPQILLGFILEYFVPFVQFKKREKCCIPALVFFLFKINGIKLNKLYQITQSVLKYFLSLLPGNINHEV